MAEIEFRGISEEVLQNLRSRFTYRKGAILLDIAQSGLDIRNHQGLRTIPVEDIMLDWNTSHDVSTVDHSACFIIAVSQ